MGILHLFFGFSGRINRGKYWLTLVIWLLIWIVAIIAFVLGGLAIFDRNLQDGSLPSPEDFDGELKDKPGMTLVAPGTTKRFEIAVGVSGRL